jgi:hypothetical protein
VVVVLVEVKVREVVEADLVEEMELDVLGMQLEAAGVLVV